MFSPLSLEEGRRLIAYLRCLGENEFSEKGECALDDMLRKLEDISLGVFLTLERTECMAGMGCRRRVRFNLGIVRPKSVVLNARELLIKAFTVGVSGRYPPVQSREFRECVIDLTLISERFRVDLNWLLERFIPGYHGLAIRKNGREVYILPQRLVEDFEAYRANGGIARDRKEFLNFLIRQYGIDSSMEIYAFETQIFYELEPHGDVIIRMPYRYRHFPPLEPGQ